MHDRCHLPAPILDNSCVKHQPVLSLTPTCQPHHTTRVLQAVIAHELGHLKCDHGVWLTIANVLASGTLSVLPAASRAVEEALLRWLRAAELTCDRAALLVVQVQAWGSVLVPACCMLGP